VSPWDVLGWLLVILVGVVVGIPVLIAAVSLLITAAFVVFSFVAAMCAGVWTRTRARIKYRQEDE